MLLKKEVLGLERKWKGKQRRKRRGHVYRLRKVGA
jgi:hypothetical protein